MNRVCDVPLEHIVYLWSQVAPHLRAALEREQPQRYRVEDLLPLFAKGEAKLWISWDPDAHKVEAAMVTVVMDFPLGRECRVWLIGGRNMRAWADEFRTESEAYARAQGCTNMVSGGRKGWSRVGGYRDVGTVFLKPLEIAA